MTKHPEDSLHKEVMVPKPISDPLIYHVWERQLHYHHSLVNLILDLDPHIAQNPLGCPNSSSSDLAVISVSHRHVPRLSKASLGKREPEGILSHERGKYKTEHLPVRMTSCPTRPHNPGCYR